MTDHEILQELLSAVKELGAGQARLETDLRGTKAYIETQIPKQINMIAEQHVDIIRKLEALSDYPETRNRVATLEGSAKMLADRIHNLEEAV